MSADAPGDEALAFELLETERVWDGFRPLDRLTVRHASLTGGADLTVRRELVRAGTVVAILPYDMARESIVAIRQFRIGAALSTPHAAPLELPAGLVDAGEEPREAALRELHEETGLRATAIGEAFSLLPSPGLSDERVVAFLALVDASTLSPAAGLAGESEDIVPLAFPLADLIEAADCGRVANGFLFASLQWFARKGHERAARLAADQA